MPLIALQSREQPQFLCLETMIDPENPIRVIDAFVDYLDRVGLQQLGFTAKGLSHQGRPAFCTSALLKLYLYGYSNRIRSARQLAKACQCNIELFWLLQYQQPKYKTIADFRKNHPKALRKTFQQFNHFLQGQGLFQSDLVAIDGTKYAAQNSKKNNFNDRKVKQHLKYINAQIDTYLDQMNILDQEEDVEQETIIEVAYKLDQLTQRKQKYQDLELQIQQVKPSGETQISTSDPDARALPKKMNIVEVGYNVQTTVEADHQLIVEYQVTNKGDVYALSSMAIQAKKALKKESIRVLADKGYDTGVELKTCAENDIITYVAPRQKNTSKKHPAYRKEQFSYDEQTDQYTCPAGYQLTSNGNWYQKNNRPLSKPYRVKIYKLPFHVCNACPHKVDCAGQANLNRINRSKGRPIERSEYEDALEQNRERVQLNKDLYRLRQQIVEHPFGTIKRQWGFSYTLLKGMEKVDGELALIHTCYNLRRSMSIFGVKTLIERLKTAFSLFLVHLASIKHQMTNLYHLAVHRIRIALSTFSLFDQFKLSLIKL